jgi:hypothetical protein
VFVCTPDGRLVGVLTERDIFGKIVGAGGLAGLANPFARPRAHEFRTAHQAAPTLLLVGAIGLGFGVFRGVTHGRGDTGDCV